MAAAMESDMAVATEGGESDIQVTVSGTIELTLP
jgi:predicted secreted protein